MNLHVSFEKRFIVEYIWSCDLYGYVQKGIISRNDA